MKAAIGEVGCRGWASPDDQVQTMDSESETELKCYKSLLRKCYVPGTVQRVEGRTQRHKTWSFQERLPI